MQLCHAILTSNRLSGTFAVFLCDVAAVLSKEGAAPPISKIALCVIISEICLAMKCLWAKGAVIGQPFSAAVICRDVAAVLSPDIVPVPLFLYFRCKVKAPAGSAF